MIPDIEGLDVDVPRINQIAVMVEDIEDGMHRFSRLFGIDAWRVIDCDAESGTHTDMTYRDGEGPFSMIAALSADLVDGEVRPWREFQTEIELIQPTAGDSVYRDFLDEHGEGIHHIACFDFEDPEGVVRAFEDAGYDILQRGTIFGTQYVYLDTAEDLNGVVFETAMSTSEKPDPSETEMIWDVVPE